MPFTELLVHLAGTGDAIARWDGEEKIHTERGHFYVRSREGSTFDGRAWWPKYIWVRW